MLFIYHDKAPQKKSALILMWKIALTSPPTQLSARFRNQQWFYLNCRVKFLKEKFLFEKFYEVLKCGYAFEGRKIVIFFIHSS